MDAHPSPEDTESILLVDNNPTHLHVLWQTLCGRGLQLLMAPSGEEALAIARKAHPALILLDIMLPGIDGFETCRQLKADPATRQAAVLFLSALGDTHDKVHGFELGAVDSITKPCQAEEVIARVTTHLTLQRLQHRLTQRNQELAAANRCIRRIFGRYVSDEVVASVLDDPDGLQLGGEERTVTCLMSDVRGFTAFAERLAPTQVVAFLNRYLEGAETPVVRCQRLGGKHHVAHQPSRGQQRPQMLRIRVASCVISPRVVQWCQGTCWLALCEGIIESRWCGRL